MIPNPNEKAPLEGKQKKQKAKEKEKESKEEKKEDLFERTMTVSRLNHWLQAEPDKFEFRQERSDWRLPDNTPTKQMKVYVNNKNEIDYYNQINVTINLNLKPLDLDEDTKFLNKSNEEDEKPKKQKVNKPRLRDAALFSASFFSQVGLFCGLLYFLNMSFVSTLMKLIYLGFLGLFPTISLLASCAGGLSLSRQLSRQKRLQISNQKYETPEAGS